MQTHDGRSQKGEVQSTSDEVQHLPIGSVVLFSNTKGSLLYTTVAVGPSSSAVVNTSGENVPCFTSLTHSSWTMIPVLSCEMHQGIENLYDFFCIFCKSVMIL